MGNSESKSESKYTQLFPNGTVTGPKLDKFLEKKQKADSGTWHRVEYIVDTGALTGIPLKVHVQPEQNSAIVGSLPAGTHFWSGHFLLKTCGNNEPREWLYIFKPLEGYVVFKHCVEELVAMGDQSVINRGYLFRHADEGVWDDVAESSSKRYAQSVAAFKNSTSTSAMKSSVQMLSNVTNNNEPYEEQNTEANNETSNAGESYGQQRAREIAEIKARATADATHPKSVKAVPTVDTAPYQILEEEPHQQTYRVNVGNPNIRVSLRDGPSTSSTTVLREVSDGDTITTVAKLRVQARDGAVAEWMRITAPVCGFALYTLQQAAIPHVNARARADNSVYELVEHHVLIQGPLPQTVFEVSECPICLWSKPDDMICQEGNTNKDQSGDVITFMYTLQCGHQLCSTCCETLAKSRPQCPMCRVQMNTSELECLIGKNSCNIEPHTNNQEWSVEAAQALVGGQWQRGPDGMNYFALRQPDGTETATNIRAAPGARIRVAPGTNITINGQRVDANQCQQQ